MHLLEKIVHFCDERVDRENITDFPGAHNGLQFQNNGKVTRVGAAVDAGLVPFQKAADAGVDLLIVHHGMFWDGAKAIVGSQYEKFKILYENNIAVYSSHLPLDGHREIGNNAIIAKKLGLTITDWVIEYAGNTFVAMCEIALERKELESKLRTLFPSSCTAISCGPKTTKRIAISSGSGTSVMPQLKAHSIDTLICGELKQNCYNQAEEEMLNLYPCGHYATEIFGIDALAQEVSKKFGIPYTFISSNCPL